MGLLKDFKDFAVKGNVVDLAVGVIIGTAFGNIVSSLVKDITMPLIGMLLDDVDLKKQQVVLREAEGDRPATILAYGTFLQNVFDFLIIALVIFAFIRVLAALKRKKEEEEAAKPAPICPEEIAVLQEIRDELRQLNKKQG